MQICSFVWVPIINKKIDTMISNGKYLYQKIFLNKNLEKKLLSRFGTGHLTVTYHSRARDSIFIAAT